MISVWENPSPLKMVAVWYLPAKATAEVGSRVTGLQKIPRHLFKNYASECHH